MSKTNQVKSYGIYSVLVVLSLCFNQLAYAVMLSEEEIQSITDLQDQYVEKKEQHEHQQLNLTKLNGELKSDKTLLQQLEAQQKNAKESYHSLQKLDIEHPEYALAEQLSMKSAAHKEASTKTQEKKADITRKENQLLIAQNDLQRSKAELDANKIKYETYVRALATRYIMQKLHAMQQSVIVKTTATAVCGDDVTPRDCRQQALAKAERKALEQGSVIVVESITEVKNFQLSYDEVHSEFKAQLSNRRLLTDTAGVGQHTIGINAEVTPMMTEALKESIHESAILEFQYQLRQAAKQIVYMPELTSGSAPSVEPKTQQQISKLQPAPSKLQTMPSKSKAIPTTPPPKPSDAVRTPVEKKTATAAPVKQNSASSNDKAKRSSNPIAFPNF